MKYKDGSEAKSGDVIRWNCCDNDDYTTWKFTGLVTSRGVVYLGGGIDVGMGIGKVISHDEVISQSENNDLDYRGIEKVGCASTLARYISKFNERMPEHEL